MRFSLVLLFLISCANAQRLSLGVAGGGSPTDAFRDRTYPQPPYDAEHSYSEAKDYFIGPTLEWQFSPRWSVEVDALFRKLHHTWEVVVPDGTVNSVSPSPVITWEFPVLAKYRFGSSSWTPFIEGGPSFRTAGNLNGTNPSHVGATAGLGVERRWGPLKFAPTVRYTRWMRDNPRWFEQTASNQVEFLLNVSATAESAWHPLGKNASIGVMFGTSLTDDIAARSQNFANVDGPGFVSSSIIPGSRRLMVGPTVEFRLPRRLSVEVDALYRRVTSKTTIVYRDPTGAIIVPDNQGDYAAVLWEFPVLVKQRFAWRRMAPFVGIGPSFRRPQSYSFSSPFGAVAGAGIEIPWGPMRISPTARYTRWAAGRVAGFEEMRLNQSEVLVGVTF
jgi:hypothetical protein